MFNNHGQMLYEWIDNDTRVKVGSNAQLDGATKKASAPNADIDKMFYYNEVEDGSRGDGWYYIDGSKDVGTGDDTDWYYIDDGDVTYAEPTTKNFATYDEDGADVFVKRKKVSGKYFSFNEKGQMQDGLQYVAADHGFYYFDENGYQKAKSGDGKKFDIENAGIAEDDVLVKTDSNGRVEKITLDGGDGTVITKATLISDMITELRATNGLQSVIEDMTVSVPFISLYDDDIYTYYGMDADGSDPVEGWLFLNSKTAATRKTSLNIAGTATTAEDAE